MDNQDIKKKVLKELSESKTEKGVYAFVLKPENYQAVNEEILVYLTKTLNWSGIYVTLNRPYEEVTENLERKKVPTKKLLLIIDGIRDKDCDADNCISLGGNKSLTQLSLIMTQACKNEAIKFVFFDSVSTLLIYNNLETVERFMHYLINKIKNSGILMIIISIDEEKSNKLMPVLSQLCNRCINI